MSTTTDVAPEPTVRRTLRVQQIFAGLGVAALIAGAGTIAATSPTAFGDPEAYVQGFYDRVDADGMFAALAPSTYAGQEEQFRAGVAQVVQQPGVVAVHNGEVVVNGTILSIVDADQLRWCVDPDGLLYVRCLVATASATVATEGTGLETGFVGADVLGDTTQFVMVLGAETPAVLAGELELVDADGEPVGVVTESYYSLQGETVPVELRDVTLETGVALIVIWEVEGADERDRILGRDLVLRWDGGELKIQLDDPTWFIS